MSNSVYHINKGVNKCLEFKGLKAQWIWWLAGGLVSLLLLFVILYIMGIPSLVCVFIALAGGGFLFVYVYKFNNKYGQYGMMRTRAQKHLPKVIRCDSRNIMCKPVK